MLGITAHCVTRSDSGASLKTRTATSEERAATATTTSSGSAPAKPVTEEQTATNKSVSKAFGAKTSGLAGTHCFNCLFQTFIVIKM